MTIPYRQPAESPLVKRAIEALKQGRMHLGFFDEYFKKDLAYGAATIAVSLLTNQPRTQENHDLHAALDQSHQAMWNAINEARTLLIEAGYEFDASDEVWWADRNDPTAPAEALAKLEALLPHADFCVQKDEEVEAYLAARRRGKLFWIWLIVLAIVGPPLAILIWGLFQL